MKMRTLTLLGLAAASALASAQYTLFPISNFSGTTDISNTGTAVGTFSPAYGIWNPKNGVAPRSIGGTSSGQAGISADGMTVGATAPGPDNRAEYAKYNVLTNTWTPYGGAGGYSGTTRSSCWGLSSDGSTVYGFGYGTPTGTATFTGIRPIAHNGTSMTDFSIIQNANSINRIMASSANGAVVTGRCRLTTTTDGTFYWVGGTPNNMYATGTTDFLGEPRAMSGDGTVIGGSGNFATTVVQLGFTHTLPYLYDTTTNTHITIDAISGINGREIPANTTRIDGFLTGLTDDGNTAVGFFRVQAPFPLIDKAWGFIWRRGIGVQTLESWAADQGIAAAVGKDLVPFGISPNGQYIGGQYRLSGQLSGGGFMITPGRSITGNVVLQDLVGPCTDPVAWALYDGTNLVESGNTVMAADGSFTIASSAPAGSYMLALKGRSHLRAVVSVDTSNPVSGLSYSLTNGDVDGDNEVGPGDFGALATAFLSVNGDPNWLATADLDCDGEVGPGDFGILANNFLASGWNP